MTNTTQSLSDGYFPPPWNFYEHVEKTEGWIAFQQAQRDDPKYYLPSLWISVKDRLPEEGYYLCFDGIRVGFAWMGPDRFELSHNYGDFVTHWMPLPEPPK